MYICQVYKYNVFWYFTLKQKLWPQDSYMCIQVPAVLPVLPGAAPQWTQWTNLVLRAVPSNHPFLDYLTQPLSSSLTSTKQIIPTAWNLQLTAGYPWHQWLATSLNAYGQQLGSNEHAQRPNSNAHTQRSGSNTHSASNPPPASLQQRTTGMNRQASSNPVCLPHHLHPIPIHICPLSLSTTTALASSYNCPRSIKTSARSSAGWL